MFQYGKEKSSMKSSEARNLVTVFLVKTAAELKMQRSALSTKPATQK